MNVSAALYLPASLVQHTRLYEVGIEVGVALLNQLTYLLPNLARLFARFGTKAFSTHIDYCLGVDKTHEVSRRIAVEA